jgi:hypothetical protein
MRILRLLSLCAAICVFPLSIPAVFAQSGHGAVQGRIIDPSGAILPGARVQLDPLGFTTVTNSQGEFTFSNIPAGNYTLSVQYVGFGRVSTSVTVSANQIARADSTL